MPCKWVRFAYRAVPLPAWQAFWLDRHIDHCPRCRGEALDDEAIRSLGVTPAELQNELRLFPPAAGRNPTRNRALGFGWRYAAGIFVAAALLGAIVALLRLPPPAPSGRGMVTVGYEEAASGIFAVLEAKIGGEPARPVVFKPRQSGMTIVWFEKKAN